MMPIDNLLTREKAIQQIGDLVEKGEEWCNYNVPKFLAFSTAQSDSYQIKSDPLKYDFTWTFTEHSRVMTALKSVREIQAECGMGLTEDTYTAYKFFADSLSRTFIATVADSYLRDSFNFDSLAKLVWGADLVVPSVVYEAFTNAIEHGSDFGKEGEVYLRLLGGQNGLLALVTDPGPGFDLKPLSEEEYSRRRREMKSARAKQTLIRGLGMGHFFDPEGPLINSERTDEGHTLLILYSLER
jgi:hypothetical protein